MSHERQIVCVVLAVACSGVLISIVLGWVNPFNDRRFSSADWAIADSTGQAHMATDLIHRELPQGMSSTAIQTLLGAPDETLTGDIDSGGNRLLSHETLSYYPRSWSLCAYDDTILCLHLDRQKKLVEARITGY